MSRFLVLFFVLFLFLLHEGGSRLTVLRSRRLCALRVRVQARVVPARRAPATGSLGAGPDDPGFFLAARVPLPATRAVDAVVEEKRDADFVCQRQARTIGFGKDATLLLQHVPVYAAHARAGAVVQAHRHVLLGILLPRSKVELKGAGRLSVAHRVESGLTSQRGGAPQLERTEEPAPL